MSCSVVVATKHRPELLDRCLAAIDALDDADVDVVVIDNSAGDEGTRRVAEKHGAAFVAVAATGLSGARNLGARMATGDIVAFVDDDAVPVAGWTAALREPFADPFVGAVTGRILPTEVVSDAQQWSMEVRWHDLGTERLEFNITTSDWFERANFGGIGFGGNMAVRRRAFDEWGGFRESFGLGAPLPGGEENYAFFELIRLGFSVVYKPDAVVLHPLPRTFGELRTRRRRLLGQAIAYMVLLVREEPPFRGRVGRYAVRKAFRRLRFRPQPGLPSWRSVFLPTDVAAAFARAPVLVWRTVRGGHDPAAGRRRPQPHLTRSAAD